MFQNSDLNKKLVYIVPFIVLSWGLYLQWITGPFYLSRIDPEFPYLLNGLNCAILEFNRIGHIDHPGTPFQLLTGFFIRIIYFFFGKGPIVEDVISRPEFYLSAASIFFTVFTALIVLWLGKIVLRPGGQLFSVVILQSSLFLTTVLINIPIRYIPDRMLMLIVLILIGLTCKYMYQKSYGGVKYAVYSGLLMGVGFVTKFNFLPLLIIPVFVVGKWKERFIYGVAFIVAAFVSFIPILDKFEQFKWFIIGIIKHDGLYGSGAEQVFNVQKFFFNISLIFQYNISFTIVFVAALVLLVVILFKPGIRKANKKEFRFLVVYLIVMVGSLVMVSKHYKNYYLIPAMSLTAFAFYIIWRINKGFTAYKHLDKIFALILVVLLIVPVKDSLTYVPYRKQVLIESNKAVSFIQNHIPETDFIVLRSAWMASPHVADGLVYGITYVDLSNLFYNEYERVYPNILTYNGENRPLGYFNMLDADNEAIFKSGKSLFVYSSPGRGANVVMDYIERNAKIYGISMKRDTVFSNLKRNEFIVKLSNISNWKTLSEEMYGFENIKDDKFLSNDGGNPLSGHYILNTEEVCNGTHSLQLDGKLHQTPVCTIKNVLKGDYIELTIKRRKNNFKEKGELVLSSLQPKLDSLYYFYGSSLSAINNDWEMVRLTAKIKRQPVDSLMRCFYQFYDTGQLYLDDIGYKHFGNRPE
jgi:hypothetical protein